MKIFKSFFLYRAFHSFLLPCRKRETGFTYEMAAPQEPLGSQGASKQELAEGMLQAFFNMGMQCLTASIDVWPEDAVLQSWKRTVDGVRGSGDARAIKEFAAHVHNIFHDNLKGSFELIRKRDEAILNANIPVFRELDLGSKWRGAHPSVRDTLWDYAKELAQFSSMYSMYASCPGGLMSKVTELASGLAGRVERGELGVGEINPLQLSQQLMSQLGEKELEEFGNSLMGNGGENLEGMMSMVQGMVGQMGGQGTQLAGLAAMLNGGGGGPGGLPGGLQGLDGLGALLGGGSGRGALPMGALGMLLGGGGGGGGGGGSPFANMLQLGNLPKHQNDREEGEH